MDNVCNVILQVKLETRSQGLLSGLEINTKQFQNALPKAKHRTWLLNVDLSEIGAPYILPRKAASFFVTLSPHDVTPKLHVVFK